MVVSFEVHKVIKFTIDDSVFSTSGGGVSEAVNLINYQGCQFDVHFIPVSNFHFENREQDCSICPEICIHIHLSHS